jgi:hypothetical protein
VKGKFISPSHFRVFAQAQYIKQLERSKWLFIYSVKNPFDMNFHISIKPKYIYIYIYSSSGSILSRDIRSCMIYNSNRRK